MPKPNELRDKIAREAVALMDSGIVKYLEGYSKEYPIKIVADALDEYAEGLREKVLREAARAMCKHCATSSPEYVPSGWGSGPLAWQHTIDARRHSCRSEAIHDLIAAMKGDRDEE